MPAALTLNLICPAPGSVSGTPAHFSTSGGPYPVITIALGMALPSWWRLWYGRKRSVVTCAGHRPARHWRSSTTYVTHHTIVRDTSRNWQPGSPACRVARVGPGWLWQRAAYHRLVAATSPVGQVSP